MKLKHIFATAILLVVAAVFPMVEYAQSGRASLKVTSFPSGAEVFVDGVDTGKTTPMSTSLSLGQHRVTVSLPAGSGWNSASRAISIVPGHNDLSLILLPALTTGPQGPQGPTGPAGPQGPAGPSSIPVVYTKRIGGPPVYVDAIYSIDDSASVVFRLTVPAGHAYFLQATTMAGLSVYSTNEPVFTCALGVEYPTGGFSNVTQFIEQLQMRPDGTQHQVPVNMQGAIDVTALSGSVDVEIRCANQDHVAFPSTGLGFFQSTLSAFPVGAIVRPSGPGF